MKRRVDMNEISDGKLYGLNDMVKADCGDCQGCHACCTGMGNSIILDPYDIYRLETGLGWDFNRLMNGFIELNVVDGVILPNIRMAGEEEKCPFLSAEGRCQVHPIRPGNCRLFPLGRIYREEGKGFDYFLQIHECRKKDRTKVKVKKWIDTPDIAKYSKFVADWHYYLEEQTQRLATMDEAAGKALVMKILTLFFVSPYSSEDFYKQFYERLTQASE